MSNSTENTARSGAGSKNKRDGFSKFYVPFAVIVLGGGTVGLAMSEISRLINGEPGLLPKYALPVLALVIAILVEFLKFNDRRSSEKKIAKIEERALEHPERPQLAWDLARAKLESYLDRNLSQVRSIFWLTLFVMGCGFGVIMFGLVKAFDSPENLPVAVVASASGVLISFIGGSFLLIYRSILAQSKEYVTVLERINAVGMAVQVIANIPEENAALKDKTTAELARQLLGLYGPKTSSRRPSSPGSV